MNALQNLLDAFVARADVGHLGLLLWAGSASAFALKLLAELSGANRRFDDFVRELNRFNARQEGEDA